MKEDLFEKYVQGTLSVEEQDLLMDLIRKDPGAGKEFVAFINETSMMVSCAQQLESKTVSTTDRPARRSVSRMPRGRGRIRWGTWISVAACLAIIAGSLFYNQYQTTRFAEVLVAHVKATAPGVSIVRRGESVVVVLDMGIYTGDRIVTGSKQSATFVYDSEETEITVDENTTLDVGSVEEGKRLKLEKGIIDAFVDPQAADRPMVVVTPHARATIKGTNLSLAVKGVKTRLDVSEGLVSFARLSDDESVDVATGQYAVVAEGVELVALAIPAETTRRPAPRKPAAQRPALPTEFPKPRPHLYGKVLFEDNFDDGIDNWMIMMKPKFDTGKKAFLVEDGAQHLWAMDKNFIPRGKQDPGVSCVIIHPNVDDMVKENKDFADIMPMFSSRKGITAERFVIEIRVHLRRTRSGGTNLLTDCIEMSESLEILSNPRGGKLSLGWHIFRAECTPAEGYPKGVLVRHFFCGPRGDRYRESALIRSNTGKIQFGIRNGTIAVDRVTVRELLPDPNEEEGAGQGE